VTQEGAVPPDFWQQVRQIAREEVAKSSRSAPLKNAAISSGGLTIQQGGSLVLMNNAGTGEQFYVGPVLPNMPDGTGQPGVIFRREDGSLALAMYDPDTSGAFKQFLALYDRSHNVIVSDDTDSGQGLARPYVPMSGFYRAKYSDWTVQTTSTTFETLWRGEMIKQHPRLSVATNASMDTSGSTGEIKVLVNGVQLGTSVATVGFALTTSLFGPAAVDVDHMKLLAVEIQGRVASGAGALRVEPLHAIGRQS
jgi:hypothetical protein